MDIVKRGLWEDQYGLQWLEMEAHDLLSSHNNKDQCTS